MKTALDPRHQKRIKILEQLFSWDFKKDKKPQILVKEIIKSQDLIDDTIAKAAPAWPINKINRIDLAILRLSIFELILIKEVPPKVVADEAVELAKEFGGETSPGFVNGVLGKVIEINNLI